MLEEYLYFSNKKKKIYIISYLTNLQTILVETNILISFSFFSSSLLSDQISGIVIRVIFSYADIQYKCIPRGIKKKKILKWNIEEEFERKLTKILWIF